MGIVAEAKRIKEIHPNYLLLYKSGNFYKAFGKDAYILNALFNYNINIVDNNVAMCGFPLKAITKVRCSIENSKINYMIIDPRNTYDVDLKEDFKNLNNYQTEFEKSYKIVKNKKIINRIVKELFLIIDEKDFKEKIRKIEEILNERREI